MPTLPKKIGLDWNQMFPEFGRYRPDWLMKIAGPMVIGIVLEKSADASFYKPTCHVHCLARPSDVITLTLWQPLHSRTGSADIIMTRSHEDVYKEAALRLQQQVPLPLKSMVYVDQFVASYRTHADRAVHGEQQVLLAADCIAILAWAGRQREASAELDQCLSRCSDEHFYKFVDGRNAFVLNMQHVIETASSLSSVVKHEVQRHQLDGLPMVPIGS